MTSISKQTRIAGLIYVLLGVVAPVRLMIIPSKLFVRGDATATANNIAAHEMLFRLGIVTDLLAGVIALFLMVALYKLFQAVDQHQAALMVILGGLMVVPIYFLNTLNDAAALILATGPDYLSVFDEAQRDAMALFFLRLHGHAVLANEVFWGLWLFPLAALIWKSGFLPRFLSVLLTINGVGYLIQSLTGILFPQAVDLMTRITFAMLFGEVVTMLWMLIVGARPRKASAPTVV